MPAAERMDLWRASALQNAFSGARANVCSANQHTKTSPDMCTKSLTSDAPPTAVCSVAMAHLPCRAAALVSRPSAVLSDLTSTSPGLRTIHLDELTDSLTG